MIRLLPVVSALLLCALPAVAGPPCGPGAGGCYVNNGTPGCENAACCSTVCAIDDFCCTSDWDFLCAQLAAEACGNCGDSAAGDCFAANGTNGCDDADCCAAVCAIDPFCCDTQWDSTCATLADQNCVGCGGALAGDCFVENGSPFCNDGDCCDAVCAIEPFCCNTDWDATCVTLADSICATCGGSGAGNCVTAGATPTCEDSNCCSAVCAIDPFCCDTRWDEQCATLAIQNCTVCGAIPAGNPFAPNGTSNSWDTACCEAVCAITPFCCDVAWDDTCVQNALAICALPCPGDVPFVSPGAVNVSDLLYVLEVWAATGMFEPGDLFPSPTGDGVVDVQDLLEVLSHWGACP